MSSISNNAIKFCTEKYYKNNDIHTFAKTIKTKKMTTDIYKLIKTVAENTIKNASDSELTETNYSDKVFNKTKISIPKIDTLNARIPDIDKEKVTHKNRVQGISISESSYNKGVNFCKFQIPIKGDIELFKNIITSKFDLQIDRTKIYVVNNLLVIQIYSQEEITGNDKLMDEIKKGVKTIVEYFTYQVNEKERIMDDYNKKDLKPYIDELISKEIALRKSKSDSQAKLNPFK